MNIKRIVICSSLLLLINGGMNAQQHQTDSIIKTNASGLPIERSYFAYDANNYQTLAMHYTYNKKTDKWNGTYRESASYDNLGNCLTKNVSHWNFDTNAWMEMIKEKSTYDSHGRRLTFDSRTWNKDRSVWLGTSKTKREFNDMGLLSADYTFKWDDDVSDWVDNWKIEYVYNDKGQCLKQTQSVWKNAWINETSTEYVYDAATRRVAQEIKKTWNGTEWVFDTQTIYKYGSKDANGVYTVEQLDQKYNGTEWADVYRLTRQLDSKDIEITQKREEYKNSKWLVVRRERAEVKYDADGNKIFDERYRWNGGDEWIGLRKEEMSYNDYGDLMKEVRMKWNPTKNQWSGLDNVVYDYSPMGELTYEQHYKWDNAKNDWVDQSIMKFEYDENHNKIEESTSSWNPVKQEWEEFYKGKFIYVYDGEGNVKSVEEYVGDKRKWKPVSTTTYY